MRVLQYVVKPIIISILAISIGCSISPSSVQQTNIVHRADLILQDGKVYTVDADRSWADLFKRPGCSCYCIFEYCIFLVFFLWRFELVVLPPPVVAGWFGD